MKKLLLIGLLVLVASQADAFTNTGRFWWYGDFTVGLSPQWAVEAKVGTMNDLIRCVDGSETTAGGMMVEFFVGPVYTMKLGESMNVKLPLLYYFAGFPANTDFYGVLSTSSHHIDIAPELEYKINDKFIFGLRLILHNTLYSTYYQPAVQFGYSLLARGMPSITYALSDKVSFYASDEVFVGLIENSNSHATYAMLPDGREGFAPKGFRTNRIYIGATYVFNPEMSVFPQYVLETNYDANKDLISVQHYAFVTFNYMLKLYK